MFDYVKLFTRSLDVILLFGSIAGIGLKAIINGNVDLMKPRNLCLVAITLVTAIGVTIGSFSLQGISLCGVLAVLLNQILPPGELEEEIKPAAFP